MVDKFSMRGSCRAPRLWAVAVADFVAVVLMASSQVRADVYWNVAPPNSGDWSNTANWSAGLPTSNDNTYVVNGGTVGVTMPGEVCYALSLGSSAESGTVQMTGGGLSPHFVYVGNSGTGNFTQSGGTDSIFNFVVANNVASSGTYSLSGSGQFWAYNGEIVGCYGTGTFTQSGGTNSGGNLDLGNYPGSSGTYNLSGNGQVSIPNEYVGYSGAGTFTQNGGANSVSSYLYLGSYSGSSGTYNLSGSGQLSAPSEYVGYFGSGTFTQNGGANTVSLLSIGSSSYLLAGGTLQIGSLVNQGIVAGSSTPAILSVNGILDLTSGTWQNMGVTSVSMGANSLLIVPAGFDVSTGFANYSTLGLTHTLGTTLTVPAGQGFGGSGSISDPVNCQGTITTASGGTLNLNGGLTLSGTGTASLGGGNLTTNDLFSSISGGWLCPYEHYVGNSGRGTFTQSGGTNNIIDSLILGYNAGDSGTYSLSGSGLLSASGTVVYNPSSEYVGYFGAGIFTQSGGNNMTHHYYYASDGSLYLGYNAGSSGTYSLNGSGRLSSGYNECVGYSGVGTFTQSGGTNSIAHYFYLGYNSGSTGTYNLGGGVLVLSSMSQGSGTAAFNFNGGTLQAAGPFFTSLPMTLGTSGGGATFDTAGFAVTLSGSLSGPGSLTKVDSGTLTLAAINTYSGNTLVGGGTLALSNPAALQNSTFDTTGSGALSFGSLTSVTLGGLTGPGTLSLANSVSGAVALSVGNNNASTTYSGMFQGAGSLAKVGTGILIVLGNNSYSDGTTISAGTLQVGNGGSGASIGSTSNVLDNGSLVFSHSDAQAFAPLISGSGSLTQTGSGILKLTNSNTYTGPTTISQGELVVDGWLTSSAVSVNGGTLGGTGHLGSVTINTGGNLAPGDSLGTLSVGGNLILSAGAVMDYELDTPATSDMISCGSLTLNGQQFSDFNFTPSANFRPGTYDLIVAGSAPGGNLGSITSGTIDGYPATLAVQGNDLVVNVVPEPSTLTLLGVGGLVLLASARRQRSRKVEIFTTKEQIND